MVVTLTVFPEGDQPASLCIGPWLYYGDLGRVGSPLLVGHINPAPNTRITGPSSDVTVNKTACPRQSACPTECPSME